jgi:release factor glutamine methyltransferase
MQLKDALAQGIALLERASIASPRITAEVLLMHAVQCERAHLHAHPERELTSNELVHFGKYLHERTQGKPTQYITGHQEFWGMDFLVNSSVLIPRSETEMVVEAAIAIARGCAAVCGTPRIADVGTGSGCIAIALARELPEARIFALDRSREALDVARQNAERHGVDTRIAFLESDLLLCSPGDALPPVEMVVSNPPYVAESDRPAIEREVRDFEPSDAVFAGQSGDEIYRRLIPQAAERMRSGGYLVLELGYDSERAVRDLLGPPEWDAVHTKSDLAGITRVITAWRMPVESP